MATHSGILAWRIPWQRSLVGYSLWVRKSRTRLSDLHAQEHHKVIFALTTYKCLKSFYFIKKKNK